MSRGGGRRVGGERAASGRSAGGPQARHDVGQRGVHGVEHGHAGAPRQVRQVVAPAVVVLHCRFAVLQIQTDFLLLIITWIYLPILVYLKKF